MRLILSNRSERHTEYVPITTDKKNITAAGTDRIVPIPIRIALTTTPPKSHTAVLQRHFERYSEKRGPSLLMSGYSSSILHPLLPRVPLRQMDNPDLNQSHFRAREMNAVGAFRDTSHLAFRQVRAARRA